MVIREKFPTICTHLDPITAVSSSLALDKPFLNQTWEAKHKHDWTEQIRVTTLKLRLQIITLDHCPPMDDNGFFVKWLAWVVM